MPAFAGRTSGGDLSSHTTPTVRSSTCTSNGFALSTELMPLPVGSETPLTNAAPSVRCHYRTLNPSTGRSPPCAPHRYSGSGGFSSLRTGATGSHVPYKILIWLRTARVPDAVQADFRTTPSLFQELDAPSVSTSSRPPSGITSKWSATGSASARTDAERPKLLWPSMSRIACWS
jgi:hypothetical protein